MALTSRRGLRFRCCRMSRHALPLQTHPSSEPLDLRPAPDRCSNPPRMDPPSRPARTQASHPLHFAVQKRTAPDIPAQAVPAISLAHSGALPRGMPPVRARPLAGTHFAATVSAAIGISACAPAIGQGRFLARGHPPSALLTMTGNSGDNGRSLSCSRKLNDKRGRPFRFPHRRSVDPQLYNGSRQACSSSVPK